MPVTPAVKPSTTSKRTMASSANGQSLYASTQARFTTSKLIQNLGSGNDGIQFSFVTSLRTVHGRD